MRESLAFLLCVLIWGSTWYGIEFQIGYTPLAWSVAIRFGLAALLLVLLARSRGQPFWFAPKHHLVFAGLGLCLFSLNYVLVYHGAYYLTSGLVAVAFSLISLANLVNGRLFLGQKIDPVIGCAAMIGVAGLGLIFSKEIEAVNLSDTGLVGLLFCLGSTCVASLGNTVAGTSHARALPLLSLNGWGMIYGTIFNLIFAVLLGDPFQIDPRPSYWIALGFLAVFGTVIAFTIYLWLIDRIGLAKSAYVAVLMPLVALAVSTLFENYVWTPVAGLGVGLIVGGNIIMARRKQAVR